LGHFVEYNAASLESIRRAEALISGRDPNLNQTKMIAAVIAFARRMVHIAPRVTVLVRSLTPSTIAANDEMARWVEFRAFESEYLLEFWESQTNLNRPPSPLRTQSYVELSQPYWLACAADNSEAWLCRAENIRWYGK
jgi:hypothetical protein